MEKYFRNSYFKSECYSLSIKISCNKVVSKRMKIEPIILLEILKKAYNSQYY